MQEYENKQSFDVIYNVLKENPQNYLGYKMLGEFYQHTNINQAFLCYEQACGLCDDVEEQKDLEERMIFCRKASNFQVHPTSFVILSYNAKDMMIDCLESVRKGCVPGSYEIVVVDNDSRDGIRDYLVGQKDIVLQLNDHNTSFAEGCNQGVKLANPYNDIFLLNNDTIVPPLALFYMRLALYEAEDIASVGPMENAGYLPQAAPGDFKTVEDWLAQAKNIHLPTRCSNEYTTWLVGFALLIRRKAWDDVGNLDERFVHGNREDTEYGFRLLMAGYQNVICHNAFIYHYGSVSMSKDPVAYNKSLWENKNRLTEKLGFDFEQYSSYNREMVGMIEGLEDRKLSVLVIGCGFGLTLSAIKYKFPKAVVIGIEGNEAIAKIGRRIANVICADVEKDILPFEEKSFDYVLVSDRLNYFEDVKSVIRKLRKVIKDDGKMLILTRNLLHGEIFIKLLKGNLETIGDNDTEIKHFYTKNEVLNLLSEAGLVPRFLLKMVMESSNVSEEETKCLEAIKKLPGVEIGNEFNTISYIITATVH